MKMSARCLTSAFACSLLVVQPALASLPLHTIPTSSVSTVLATDDAIERIMANVDSPSMSSTGGKLAVLPVSGSLFMVDTMAGAAGLAGIAYYTRTGKDPVYAAASAVASAADALFVPAYQAFKANFVSPESYPASAAQYVGVEGSVGATIGDLVDFVKSSASGSYSHLKSLIDDSTPTPYNPTAVTTAPTTGAKIDQNGNGWDVPQWEYSGNFYANYPTSLFAGFISNAMILSSTTGFIYYANRLYTWSYSSGPNPGYVWHMYRSINATTLDPASLPAAPGSLDFEALKAALNQANMDAAIADDIRSAFQHMPAEQKLASSDPAPSAVPSSDFKPITNGDISNFFTSNTTNIYNQHLTDINSESTTISNEAARAAAETAAAQEEEAKEKEEESFEGISNNAFEDPYNPGEYDIPERFSSFLNTVKSSGLFSFSSSFFNSLPGGGSPVYEIEAGQYGHHSIDLSQTLSTGLAVLKTVLLACFGFLSIRAVIMKR